MGSVIRPEYTKDSTKIKIWRIFPEKCKILSAFSHLVLKFQNHPHQKYSSLRRIKWKIKLISTIIGTNFCFEWMLDFANRFDFATKDPEHYFGKKNSKIGKKILLFIFFFCSWPKSEPKNANFSIFPIWRGEISPFLPSGPLTVRIRLIELLWKDECP